jgi:hypothetical protein
MTVRRDTAAAVKRRDANGRLAIMNPSAATAIERRSSADRRFYLLAAIGLLLVLLIAADGVCKGLDTIVPDYYRHTASLAIAISEAAHGTYGLRPAKCRREIN